jgi:hypothetical protein
LTAVLAEHEAAAFAWLHYEPRLLLGSQRRSTQAVFVPLAVHAFRRS